VSLRSSIGALLVEDHESVAHATRSLLESMGCATARVAH